MKENVEEINEMKNMDVISNDISSIIFQENSEKESEIISKKTDSSRFSVMIDDLSGLNPLRDVNKEDKSSNRISKRKAIM